MVLNRFLKGEFKMVDPDILQHRVLLTTSTTVTIVTSAAAYVIDKKTGKVIKVIPEKGNPNYFKLAEAAVAASSALTTTANVRGLDETRELAAKLLLSSVNAIEATTKAATTNVEK